MDGGGALALRGEAEIGKRSLLDAARAARRGHGLTAGVAITALGLLVRELRGPATSDALASQLIGPLLGTTAIGLAHPLVGYAPWCTSVLFGRRTRAASAMAAAGRSA